MAETRIRTAQLEDDGVSRADLNTTVSGRAVVRKIVAGTGISLSSTGADTGTGDVTVNVAGAVRDVTVTQSATPAINTDSGDFFEITGLTSNISSMTTNLTGTPSRGQKLWIAITGTAARTISWGASFEASTAALPTTTVSTNRLDVGFVWNSVTSKWRCVAAA